MATKNETLLHEIAMHRWAVESNRRITPLGVDHALWDAAGVGPQPTMPARAPAPEAPAPAVFGLGVCHGHSPLHTLDECVAQKHGYLWRPSAPAAARAETRRHPVTAMHYSLVSTAAPEAPPQSACDDRCVGTGRGWRCDGTGPAHTGDK